MPSIEEAKKAAIAAKEAAKIRIELVRKELAANRGKKPIPNPLKDLVVTGDTEADDKAEAEVILGALGKARAGLAANQQQGYYRCIVFQSDEQAKAFILESGWAKHLDSSGCCVDGLAIAESLGIKLPPDNRTDTKHSGDKRLINEVGILKVKTS